MRYLLPLLLFIAAVAAAFYARPTLLSDLFPEREAVSEFYYTTEEVRRGDVQFVLRETGMLFPREPVLIKTKWHGMLKWIVEEGSWVEKGETVFVVSEDEELKKVTELRTQLLGARQELKLAKMKREHAEETERRKLDAAQRSHELQQIRYEILTAQPKGGTELIRIHEQLVPLEKETAKVRRQYEIAQVRYQTAQDAYLDSLDAWQAQRDKILQVQAKIDEYSAEEDRDTETMQPKELEKHQEKMQKLKDAKDEIEKLRNDMPERTSGLKDARSARNKAKAPRDEVAAVLSGREAKEKGLYIQLEIEKRGVSLANLRLDEKGAQRSLVEARRKYENAKSSFDAGSVTKSFVEDLEAKMKTAQSQLRIVEQKIKIAERPPPPEELAEAHTKLERAKANAENAQEVYERALEILDTEIEMLEAKVKMLDANIERRSRTFPTIIESNLEFSRKELALLDDDETERRKEIEEDLGRLEKQLEEVSKNPPNIAKAPVSGIARLRRRGRDPLKAGDEVWEEDANVMLYPPENMEVMAKVNEVNLKHLKRGMKAKLIVPSLKGFDTSGEIYQIAGVGKDKFEEFSRWYKASFADVTQFDIRIRLEEADPGFRQGMTVMLEIVIDEQKDVLWLPLSAVNTEGGKPRVLTGRADSPVEKAISGEVFGDDRFVVAEGLSEGEKVLVKRRRNK